MLMPSIISRMKILRLSTFLDFGGVETRLANVSHIQDENEWIFVCMNREGKAAEIIKENNKKVINLNTKPSIYSLKTFWSIYKALKKEKPDVLHSSGAEANFHGILAAKLAGIKTIIGEEIGTPQHSKKAQLIFSFVYKFANYVVGNSQAVLEVVHQLDKVPQEKLVKIDNPIIFKNLDLYKTDIQTDKVFRMLMVSRLEPVKNIDGVLNVVKKLVQNNYHVKLTIAGTGSLERELKQKVTALQMDKFVEFVGFITDPYPYLQNADLYILNSFTEGFSNSLVEAMYSKTPVLSTAVGAAPEIIEDCENGFLVASNDEQALFEKLKNIFALNNEERKQIGENGHHTITTNFSLEKHIGALMKIYKIQP